MQMLRICQIFGIQNPHISWKKYFEISAFPMFEFFIFILLHISGQG